MIKSASDKKNSSIKSRKDMSAGGLGESNMYDSPPDKVSAQKQEETNSIDTKIEGKLKDSIYEVKEFNVGLIETAQYKDEAIVELIEAKEEQ